jgi:iron complex outermembrane recepter protein
MIGERLAHVPRPASGLSATDRSFFLIFVGLSHFIRYTSHEGNTAHKNIQRQAILGGKLQATAAARRNRENFRARGFALRTLLSAALLGLASPAATADAVDNRLSARTSFNIPAQPLGTSLKQLARQAGIQILFEEAIVSGLQAPAVNTLETPLQALDALLAGTGLEFAAKNATIAVRKKSAIPASSSGAGPHGSAASTDQRYERGPPNASQGTLRASPAADPNSSAAEKTNLDEIVVTARRKQESLRTVPVSASVINADILASQGFQTTNDLQRLLPGVLLNSSGPVSDSTYTIRGQGKAVTGPGLPSVVTYFNEVPLPSTGSYTPLFDMGNVQVLKGPQGTLFGRNTTGGAVLVYSVEPSYESNGYLQADLGNYSKHSFQGAINLPIVANRLAIRVAADIERQNGFTRNITSGHNQDDTHTDAARVSILAQPAKSIKNVAIFDFTKYDTNGPGIFPYQVIDPAATPQLAAAAAAIYALGNRTLATVGPNPFETDTYWGISNTTTVTLGPATLENILGYRSTRASHANGDGFDGAPMPAFLASFGLGLVPGQPSVFLITRGGIEQTQFTEEAQLSGAALQDKLAWLAGVFYLHERPDAQDGQTLDIYRPLSPSPTTSFIVNNFLGGIWPLSSLTDSLYGETSKAVYGNLGYELWHGFRLNAGYRFTWDTESVCANGRTSILLATGLSAIPLYDSLRQCRADLGSPFGPASFHSSAAFHTPTYTLGFDYELNEDVFVYFTTRRGYRAGGLNTPALAPSLSAFQTYDPQTVTDYEIGAHTTWSNGDSRGRLNIATFISHFKDLQVNAEGITPGGPNVPPDVTGANAPTNTGIMINAGTATSQGVEIDGAISPLHSLNFNFGAAYLSQRYDSLVAVALLEPFVSRSAFLGSPKWSYQVAMQYQLPVKPAAGELLLSASHYYIGATVQQSTAPVPGCHSTSFDVDWLHVYGKPIDVTFYVDNAFDTASINNVLIGNPSFGVYSGGYAPPRMYGARVRFNF